MPNSVTVSALVALCGLVEFLLAFYFFEKYLRKRRSYTCHVDARCTRMTSVTHHDYEGQYPNQVDHPYLVYSVKGIEYETVLDVTAVASKAVVGGIVRLRCNPEQPDEYCLDEDSVTREIYIAFIVSGALTMVIGLGIMFLVS